MGICLKCAKVHIFSVLLVTGETRAFVNHRRWRKWLLVGASTVALRAHERTKLRSPSSPRGGPRRGAGPERGSSILRQQGGSGLAGGRYAQREPGGGGGRYARTLTCLLLHARGKKKATGCQRTLVAGACGQPPPGRGGCPGSAALSRDLGGTWGRWRRLC